MHCWLQQIYPQNNSLRKSIIILSPLGELFPLNKSHVTLKPHSGISVLLMCHAILFQTHHKDKIYHYVTVWLNRMSACTWTGLCPAPMVIWCPRNSNRIQCESTNQEWERWPNVWMNTLLNARYYYNPHSVLVLLLVNLLGNRGPTRGKHVFCLEPSQWVWALNGSTYELYYLVEVPPLLPSPYKSPDPPVMSGEVGWTAGSMHLHHALGTFSGMGSHPDPHPYWEVQTPIMLLEL